MVRDAECMWPVCVCLQNLAEAEYAVALYMYMRLLGYPADRISILTTYNGQKHLIRDVINQRCAGNSFFGQPSKVRAADMMISCFIYRSERLTLRPTVLMCVPVHGRVNCINVCEQLVLCSKWVFFLPSVHCFASFAAVDRFAGACCWGWLADGLTKACKGPTVCQNCTTVQIDPAVASVSHFIRVMTEYKPNK